VLVRTERAGVYGLGDEAERRLAAFSPAAREASAAPEPPAAPRRAKTARVAKVAGRGERKRAVRG
jgi:hypothetical protein